MTELLARLRDAFAERYPIERLLGRGGMATVYLSRDLKHSRPVALKVLHPELAAGLGAERFLREIRIEANLQHPHILPLHDSGEADGFLYYVMPYVAGESLRERLTQEGTLPIEDALRIAGNVADALGHAHERGVVHRDIKPENILLSGGHALVADFGIAKAVEVAGDTRLTETGWGMGTPAYMSPEQIGGGVVDGRSDVYGLGCVLYEMLGGHPPFTGATARAIFAQHHVDPVPSLRGLRPEVPAHVEQAVLTALAKEPADRFATVAELRDALSNPGTGAPLLRPATPSTSSPAGTVERGAASGAGPVGVAASGAPSARVGSRRMLVGLAAAGVVAIGGYLAAFRADRGTGLAGRAASVAVVPIEDLDGDTSQAYVAEGMTDELITDLTKIASLRVINRQTMMTYRRPGKTPREIARELGVDAVVTGTMQRLGDTVHLTAHVTLAGNDQALWAESYDGSRGELLRVQRDVARAVGEQIGGGLTPGDRARLAAVRPVEAEVLDLYVRGRYWWNKRSRKDLLKSIDFFNGALDRDPTFARAYSALADAYVQLGYGGHLTPDDAFPKSRAAAEKALSLDSTLAEPHAALAFVHMYYDWDWKAADRDFRIAIGRNPSYATAHEWYGLFLAAMGRFDSAQAEERRAQTLEPLSVAVAGTAGWVLHYSGRQGEAARRLRVALRTDSAFALGRLYLGRVHQAEGRLDSAAIYYQSMGRQSGWVPTIAGLGNLHGQLGRRREALEQRARLDSLAKAGKYVTAYGVALIYAGLGDKDSAFAWLDRGVQERTHWMVWLNRDRRWIPLRSDPRFAALVKRVGLPS